MVNCEHCSSTFTRRDNLQRHMRTAHPPDIEEEINESTASEEVEMEDTQESENSNVESEGDDEQDESKSEEEDEENEEESEDDDKPDPWRNVVANVARHFSEEYDTPNNVLREPFLSQFVEEMRKVVERRVKFVNHIVNDDDLYEMITDRYDKFMEEGFTNEDASESAWHYLRFPIRNVIKENIDLLEEDEDYELYS